MKKIENSYKKSGVNISLANKLVNHISYLSKKMSKNEIILTYGYNWRFWLALRH